MEPHTPNLTLGFSTQHGRFTIRPSPERGQIYMLVMEESGSGLRDLGRYCSINDAILAVANQETGYLPWDGLCLEQIPYKVHDITCWDFEEISGTKEEQSRSHATG